MRDEGPYTRPISPPPPGVAPHDPAEKAWALNRPPQHRVPVPQSGDHVMYRHHEWGPVGPAQVTRVVGPIPPLPDHDHNVYATVAKAPGMPPLLDGAGRRLLAVKPDPDPVVELRTAHGRVHTREARIRGSAGWLPLDWETRWRPGGAGSVNPEAEMSEGAKH